MNSVYSCMFQDVVLQLPDVEGTDIEEIKYNGKLFSYFILAPLLHRLFLDHDIIFYF